MVSSVLRTPTAIAVSVQVVRAFVRLREIILGNEKLRRKLAQIERTLMDHNKNFGIVFNALEQLMEEASEHAAKPRIGYETEEKSRGR